MSSVIARPRRGEQSGPSRLDQDLLGSVAEHSNSRERIICGRRGIMMHGEIPATSPTTGDMHDLRRTARNRSPSAALPSPSIQARRVAPASQTAFAEIPSAGRAPSHGPRPLGRVTVLSTRDRPFVAPPFLAPTGERLPPPRVRADAGDGLQYAAPQSRHARDVYLSSLVEELFVVFSSILLFGHLWQCPIRHLWQFLIRLWITLWMIRPRRSPAPLWSDGSQRAWSDTSAPIDSGGAAP